MWRCIQCTPKRMPTFEWSTDSFVCRAFEAGRAGSEDRRIKRNRQTRHGVTEIISIAVKAVRWTAQIDESQRRVESAAIQVRHTGKGRIRASGALCVTTPILSVCFQKQILARVDSAAHGDNNYRDSHGNANKRVLKLYLGQGRRENR